MIIKIKDAEKNKRINILGVPHGIVFHESSSKCMSTVHHKAFIGDIEKILELSLIHISEPTRPY